MIILRKSKLFSSKLNFRSPLALSPKHWRIYDNLRENFVLSGGKSFYPKDVNFFDKSGTEHARRIKIPKSKRIPKKLRGPLEILAGNKQLSFDDIKYTDPEQFKKLGL